jgi:hypothetical protein
MRRQQTPGQLWTFRNRKTSEEITGVLPIKCGESNEFARWLSRPSNPRGGIWASRQFLHDCRIAFYEANCEKRRRYSISYYAANSEDRKAYTISYKAANSEKVKAGQRLWKRKNYEKSIAASATAEIRKLLRFLNLPKDFNIEEVASRQDISNEQLEQATKGHGWPDWKKEFLEEKRPGDYLRDVQWARAILEYRAKREYKIAYRFTSIKRKIFENVFLFYKWQLKRASKGDLC